MNSENVYIAVYMVVLVGTFFTPAIGGLVVVGQMLMEYGNCKYVG